MIKTKTIRQMQGRVWVTLDGCVVSCEHSDLSGVEHEFTSAAAAKAFFDSLTTYSTWGRTAKAEGRIGR